MAYPARTRMRIQRQRAYARAHQRRAPMRPQNRKRAVRYQRARSLLRNDFTLPKFTLAQINPFARDAMHCRVPDESTAPSSSFYTYDEQGISANNAITGGAAAVYYLPSCGTFATYANSATATTWTWAAAYGQTSVTAKQSVINTQFALARPVAHGVRLTCPLAPTSVTGTVHVALYSMSTYNQSTWALPTNLTQLAELPFYRRCTLASLTQTPLMIANRYLDQTAFRYMAVQAIDAVNTAGGQFQVPNSWMGILVVVEGHNQNAGVTVVNVEAIGHYEGQSSWGGLTQDQVAEPSRPLVMEATARMSSARDPVVQGDEMCINTAVKDAVADFSRKIVASAGRNIAQVADNLVDHGTNLAIQAVGKPGVSKRDIDTVTSVLTGAVASSLGKYVARQTSRSGIAIASNRVQELTQG